ncbi:hypothetical protein V6N13_088549 [Hibiscus sabdariffa]|uniref:Uncharacterized protein n=1 Tax=Hibiscus sabdariffa TaxID=183260 RepID=A0ABR2FZN1_9ROSI
MRKRIPTSQKKKPQVEMKLTRQKQRAEKRPRGDRCRGRKIAVFGGSSGVGGKKQQCNCRRRIGQMKRELRKMKVGVNVMAAQVEAEAKLQGLVRTRNELMDYLWEMEATEALLMGFL